MAIGNYKDVYTVEEYENRVQNIGDSIITLKNGQFFFEAKKRLENQIKTLKRKEEQIFKLLKVKNLEELNQRLEQYRNAVLNLSGADLNNSFLAVLRWKSEKEFRAFEEAVQSVINEEILEGKPIVDWGIQTAQKKVLETISQGWEGVKGVRFSSTSGMTKTTFNPAAFTREQTERWKKLLATRYKENSKAHEYNITITSTSASIKNEFTWLGITENLTQTEAKLLSMEEINEINRKIKDLILSKVSDQYLIGQIITYILTQDPYAFFVGKNINDITGILGEIQGIYYLAKFLGDDFSTALKWRGGLHIGQDGKKPHQDILLGKFGIQVKNTSKEDLFGSDISFANAGIETILNKLNISSEAKDLFYNYYATLSFNVEYHRDRRKNVGAQYVSGIRMTDKGADHFVQLHSQLEKYENDINQLLSLFASTLMYIDIYNRNYNMDANVLYLLGGTAFQTASNILSTILKELELQERSFNIRANFKKDKNIITALNDGARGKNYSDFVLNDIVLTSSFRF